MSWQVRATAGAELFAQYDERGPVYRLTTDGQLSEQLRPLDILEPMASLDEVVDVMLEMIKEVQLAKPARVALAKALGVEPEDVGTAPVRKPRAGAA
jgi:N-acyl-L-homoserine lactone synthetase